MVAQDLAGFLLLDSNACLIAYESGWLDQIDRENLPGLYCHSSSFTPNRLNSSINLGSASI